MSIHSLIGCRLSAPALVLLCSLSGAVPPVLASVPQFDATLAVEPDQSYSALVGQAEQMADRLVQQGFQNPTATEVTIRILGERGGTVAPLLYLRVSRGDWQRQPRVQTWASYFGMARMLLGFIPAQGNQPSVAAAASWRALVPESEPNYYDNR